MPIYEYKCKKCGEKFELRLGFFHDKKSLKCPKCGCEDPERVFSPFATSGSSDGSSYSSSGSSCSSSSFS
jgi:putative FmdB family regulatory protein